MHKVSYWISPLNLILLEKWSKNYIKLFYFTSFWIKQRPRVNFSKHLQYFNKILNKKAVGQAHKIDNLSGLPVEDRSKQMTTCL